MNGTFHPTDAVEGATYLVRNYPLEQKGDIAFVPYIQRTFLVPNP